MQFGGFGRDGPAPDPTRGLRDRIRALLAVQFFFFLLPSGRILTSSAGAARGISLLRPGSILLTTPPGCQAEHGKLEGQFNSEVRALEKKYLDLYRPFFERRSAIVSGTAEPTDEEIAAGHKVEDEDRRKLIDEFGIDVAGPKEEKEEGGTDGDGKDEADGDVVGIPDFWLTALKNHPRVSDLITDRDVAPLRALTDISLCYLPDETPGFRLTFKFAENDTFSNGELLKSYYYLPESASGGGGGGDLHYDRAEGTEVLWKPGRDLTVSVEARRRRRAGTNETRVVKETVPAPTFFDFFRPPLRRRLRRLGPDDDDDEEAAAAAAEDDPDVEELIEADYDLGEEFKTSIIPRAGDWFTGKALRYERLDDLFDEDDGEEEDEDDEEEE